MGNPITSTTLLVIGTVAEGTKAFQQTQAANAKMEALKLQSKQSTVKHQQEVLTNMDILEKTLQAQTAEATTRGVSLGSLSFEAIQRDTINEAAKAERNLDLEESIFQKSLKIEKKNVQTSLFANLFGDIAAVGFDFARYQASVPKTKQG